MYQDFLVASYRVRYSLKRLLKDFVSTNQNFQKDYIPFITFFKKWKFIDKFLEFERPLQ